MKHSTPSRFCIVSDLYYWFIRHSMRLECLVGIHEEANRLKKVVYKSMIFRVSQNDIYEMEKTGTCHLRLPQARAKYFVYILNGGGDCDNVPKNARPLLDTSINTLCKLLIVKMKDPKDEVHEILQTFEVHFFLSMSHCQNDIF